MAEVAKIDYTSFELQDYNIKDENLITTFDINTTFSTSSCIEFYILDLNKNVLYNKYDYVNYTVTNDARSLLDDRISQFTINPGQDVTGNGFANGQYIAYYNFLNKEIGDYNFTLYISEISSDRQEIRLDSRFISPSNLIEQTDNFIDFRDEAEYFVDFYLNFGNNDLIIANNIKLEDENTDNPTILVKLYEPLPDQFQIKDETWVVTAFNEPEAYSVVNKVTSTFTTPTPLLQGPNFSIPLKDQVNNSSQNLSYTDIISSAPTSSQDQIDSLLSQSSINISVDYTNFSDFINFSSAQTRIENFYYKVGQVQSFTSQSNSLTNVTGSSTSKVILEKKVSNIIKNFDKFEYFMYYSSGSTISYPKSNSSEPYILFPTTSSQVLTWLGSTNESNANFGGQLLSASNYDNENPDQLKKAIPEYLREDPANQPYDLFVDMVAQYYDNIWLYTKDITQKYNADNRLDFGVSKDLVSDAIKDFGVKLYQNNFSNKELYTAFLGLTPEGSTFPFPEITGSTPVSTGMEFVDTLISASNDVISMDDTNKSLYKRIYHNIPYLLKSKGTLAGLRALITSYGIPDTILKISEFGGKDQVNANDYDLYFNNFNYAFNTTNNFISSSWAVNSSWGATNNRPSTVQFRFKSEEFPPTNLSQSLWQINSSGITGELLLDYNGSGSLSGSYNGSIKDPNYQYTNLRFIPSNEDSTISASISLPFYNGDWWSVMITADQVGAYSLYAGNKIYNGNDGTSLGYYASASITGAEVESWRNGSVSSFASDSINYADTHKIFSGSLQEIRYYTQQISESVFKDYIMNPLSIEGNGVNSAPDQLIFRAALGSELDINTSSSIHPKVTGSYNITSSFASNSNFYFSGSTQYYKNTEYFFLDQPAAGIKNRTTDKIRSENDTIPSGSVLSPIRKLSQITEASASYTDNINYLEVAFSPQNQINDDIIGQLGHFNIGDYIGDPAQRFTGNNYPDLNNLSEEYFKKYIKQYDLVDFVRLIKFFDNSLFKMIKDFIPARTSLASGLVIKQHLLERNKYPQPQVTQSLELLTGSIKSTRIWNTASQATEISSSLIESFNGGAAGMFNPFNISYDLDYFSGSVTSNFTVSASSGDGLSLTNGNTFISGAAGPPITNASSLSYFSTFIPNLYVQVYEAASPSTLFSFNSGSKPGPNTNVSASGRFNSATGNNTFNINIQNTNVAGGVISNYQNFRTEGFLRTTPSIFNDTDGNVLTNDSTVTSLSSTQIVTTFTTKSVETNVSSSIIAEFTTAGGFANRYTISTDTTNVTGNDSSNFQDFRTEGYVTTTDPIFDDGSGNPVSSSEISSLNTSTGGFRTTFNTSSVQTQVSASGTMQYSPPAGSNRFTLITSASNTSNGFDFSQFEAGNTFVSCSLPAEVTLYPFDDGTVSGTGIAAITSITPASNRLEVTLPADGRKAGTDSIVYPFSIISGSSSGPTTFVSESVRTIGSPTFTFRTGSISQGTAGSTTFISSSARDLSAVDFEFRSGSIGAIGDTTTYISASTVPLSHSRAQVASIGADNVIDFASDWTINSVGESSGEEFQLFDSLTGGSNAFASSSTELTFRNNQLNQIPTPIFDITQSYSVTTPSISGSVTVIHNSQDEFYDGELSGSVILATNGELNEECANFKEVNPFLADYKVRVYSDTITGFTEGKFLQNNNLPIDGYIQLFYGDEPGTPLAPILPETSLD